MAEAAVSPAETKLEAEVPARQAAHGNREMGLGAVFIFSISSIGLVYSGLLSFSSLAGMWPGSNLAGMIMVGGLIALLLTYTFAAIGTVAPRYGADYLVASRVLSPPLAFASSWTLVIFLAMAAGSVIAMVTQSIIPMFAKSLSLVVYDRSLLAIIDWVSSASGTITVGTIGVILLFLALITPAVVTRRILLFGTILAFVTWAWLCFTLAMANPTAFQAAWDQFMGAGTFANQIPVAESMGMKLDFSTGAMLVAGLLLSLWVFSGAFNPVYVAGEVKEPKKNILAGSVLALIAAMGILALSAFLLQRLVPPGWLSAQSFLSHTSAYGKIAMPWLPLYMAILNPNQILLKAIGLSWIFSLVTMALVFLYIGSRIMLAWSADHLLPESVAIVHPQLRSPLVAVLFVCLLADVGLVEAALNTGINNRVNAVFFFIGVELLPVLGITLLPFVRRAWFRQSSGFVRAGIGPLPLISLLGGLSVVALIGMLVALVIWPGYYPLNSETVIWFAVMFFSGLGYYYARRLFLARQGTDLDPLLRSTPEE